MTRSLDAIENAMTCLVAQVALEPIANGYVESWKHCMERGLPFNPIEDLTAAAEAHGVPVLTDIPLFSYLDQCAYEYSVPDPRRIIVCIVHGYAEENFKMGLCSCPARKPLIEGLTRLA